MLIRSLLIALSALIFSGCAVMDYFIIADSETSIPESESGDAPPNLLWEDHIFDLGSYCWTSGNVGICVDMMAPEYTEEQHLAVVDEMALQFAEPFPSSISVTLYPGSNLFAQEAVPAEATMDENGLISLSIPDNLQGLYVLAIFATWDGGDAFYTLPISVEEEMGTFVEVEMNQPPPSLTWEANVFDLGPYCWDVNGDFAGCRDIYQPSYTEEDHFTISATMLVQFAEPWPDRVSALLYPGSFIYRATATEIEVVLGEAGEALITLPENNSGLYVLVVSADWQNADADYYLPIQLAP